MSSLRERGGNLWRSDDGAERAAVPDSFRHRDDVGNHALRFETPIMRASPPKPGLHFIGDADPTGVAHVLVSMFEITIGKNDATADTLDRFGDERSDLAGRRVIDEILHVRGIFSPSIGIIPSPGDSLRIGCYGVMNAIAVWYIKFPRAMRSEAHRQSVSAVVPISQSDGVVVSRVNTRHEQGQIVCFRARVYT